MAKDKRVEKVRFTSWRPFGPQIMVGDMPDNIYKEFYGIIKTTLKDKESTHDYKLAGRIDDEYTIPDRLLYQTQTEEFFEQVVEKYARDVAERQIFEAQQFGNASHKTWKQTMDNAEFTINRLSGWVNEMKSGEYNPMHYHPYCNITSVFFFSDVNEKFLDGIIAPTSNLDENGEVRIDEKNADDGMLDIIYSTNNYWQTGSVRVRPKKGMFLLFPGDLLHTVYPFKSKSTRISASFNFIVQSNLSGINYGER